MRPIRARTAAAGVGVALVASLGWAQPAGAADVAARCAALEGVVIPAGAMGLPTTGGEVTAASVVPASGAGAAAIGEHCKVRAALHSVDPAAPDIQMQVALLTTCKRKAPLLCGGV